MDVTRTLEVHLREREQLIERFTEVMPADDRIVAAALTSSYAQGNTDALSDLDILVIVQDSSVDDFVPPHKHEVDRFEDVVWYQEVRGNAPPGGSYLGVGFRGTGYPLCTDWYWQPQSLSVFPTPSVPIVEKVPIERSPHETMTAIVMAGRPQYPPPPTSLEFTPVDPVAAKWSFKLAFFWRMSGVVAVRLARGDVEDAERICAQLTSMLTDLTGAQAPQTGSGFVWLRALTTFAETLVEHARGLGAIIPDDRSWIAETIEFMEALTRAGWRSPKVSTRQ